MNVIKQVTTNQNANEQLLYFTSSSLLKSDTELIFISNRTGEPNIFYRDLITDNESQLTFNTEGVLKSYVYFDGNEYKGLGKASVSLDSENGFLYYIQGKDLCQVNMQGELKVLAQLPDNQVTAFTHVSVDGKKICVPTTDARALEGYEMGKSNYDIDQRVREENLNSYLCVYDTETGEKLLNEVVPCAWITHVQFSPIDSTTILYNHEWPSDCGIRRMWLWDGENHIRLRTEDENRSRLDWTCHEMWERDGKGIIYHGSFNNGAPYVGKLFLEDMRIVEIPFPPQYTKYGHFTVSNDGMLVSDGYYETEDERENEQPTYISIQKPNWEAETLEWVPLCKHNSNFHLQDNHPHPIYNHKGNVIYFTSNKDGYRAVYSCKV